MAKKKKNSRKKDPKVEKIIDQKIQEQAVSVNEEPVETEVPEEAEVLVPESVEPATDAAEVQAPEAIETATDAVADQALDVTEPVGDVAEEQAPAETADVDDHVSEILDTDEKPEAAPVEVIEEVTFEGAPEDADVADQALDVTESVEDVAEEQTPAETANVDDHVSELLDTDEKPEAAPAEVTDFTLVMEPFNPDNEVAQATADAGKQVIQDTADAGKQAAQAPVTPTNSSNQEPVTTTALTTVIPAVSESENDAKEKQDKKALAREKGDLFFRKPVTRKLLAAALAATLVLNGAITAGIMALYAKSIRDDISEVSKSVSELDSELSSGNGDSGFGFMPPDWNSGDNGWNSDDWYGNDRGYDDWYNDDYFNGSPEAGQPEDQPGQQRSSGTSIGIVISDDNGVIITQVTGSNAQKAGFQNGDKIISFDGKSISDSNSLISEVQKHNSGDKVKVVVERDGKNVTINTELE